MKLPFMSRFANTRTLGSNEPLPFRQLWIAQAVSQLGSQISGLAVPVAAVVTLHATAAQMGWLAALSNVPRILLGTPLGIAVDRLNRTTILVAANVLQGAALLLIPVAYLSQRLTLPVLYGVTLLTGTCAIAFVLAYHALLPTIVSRDRLVAANGKLSLTASIAAVAGPGLAGVIVARISAPLAVGLDACSFFVAAGLIHLIRAPVRGARRPASASVRQDLHEGLQALWQLQALRSATLVMGLGSLLGSWLTAIRVLFYVRELGMNPTVLGFVLGIGAFGAVAGGLLIHRFAQTAGLGPVVAGSLSVGGLVQIGVALLPPDRTAAFLAVALGEVLRNLATVAFVTSSTSLRQLLTPNHLQGRVGGVTRSAMAVFNLAGALLGGLMGGWVGVRSAVWIGAALMLAYALVVWRSGATAQWTRAVQMSGVSQ